MTEKIILDGMGNAGTALARAIAEVTWPNGYPILELHDFGVWKRKHAEAALVGWAQVGIPKAQSIAGCLRAAGWPADRVLARQGDVRDRPRSDYRNSITLAMTDSHACKNHSVLKARQAGSPSLAIGLGRAEAVIECFSPEGPGYCCIHGAEPSWCRRVPCLPNASVSTTQLAWSASPQTVRTSGRLAAAIVAEYLATGVFPGGTGLHVHDGVVERFSFGRDANCIGPHDPPFTAGDARVIRVAVKAGESLLGDLLSRVGAVAYYADRELGWSWHCPRCETSVQRVHTVHPAATCASAGQRCWPASSEPAGLAPPNWPNFMAAPSR